MIAHFRRYQRAIYLVVTVVIIISFSFFGTYSSFTKDPSLQDEVIATLSDGTKVLQSEHKRFTDFLSESHFQKENQADINPMNSGFLEESILGTPFGREFIRGFDIDFRDEFLVKLEQEKKFQPYQHPTASFVSARSAWSYFAPQMEKHLLEFQKINSENSIEEIYEAKKNLYLSERAFPSSFLKQVLYYQQKQYSWIDPDLALESKNVNLFGYTNFQDWFGKKFLSSIVLAVMETAVDAQKKGFHISYDEARLQLYSNARKYLLKISREEEELSNEIVESQVQQLVQRALIRYGIEEYEAVEMMKKCLLFQMSIDAIPSHIIPSMQPFEKFLRDSTVEADIVTYTLPDWFGSSSLHNLLKTQLWIDAVASRDSLGEDSLLLPKTFLTAEMVSQKYPTLVQKRFFISLTKAKKEDLLQRVRIKDIWSWICVDAHWNTLTHSYPILLEQKKESAGERVQIYEAMQGEIKRSIDRFIRRQIVDVHPEWIQESLHNQNPISQELILRLTSETPPLDGITNISSLLQLLESAPIGVENASLFEYSQDQEYFYKIIVLDRSPEYEIVSLEKAFQDGTLDLLLKSSVRSYYENIQKKKEKIIELQKENGEYRDLQEVYDLLLQRLYKPYREKIKNLVPRIKEDVPNYMNWDDLSNKEESQYPYGAIRYLPFIKEIVDQGMQVVDISSVVKGKKEQLDNITKNESAHLNFDPMSASLNTTWYLVKEKKSLLKREAASLPQVHALFGQKKGGVTGLYYDKEQKSPSFSILENIRERGSYFYKDFFKTAVLSARFLGDEAIEERSSQIIRSLQEKKIVIPRNL